MGTRITNAKHAIQNVRRAYLKRFVKLATVVIT